VMSITRLFPSSITKIGIGDAIRKVVTNCFSKYLKRCMKIIVFFYETRSCSVPMMTRKKQRTIP
jgi:hypothetical protein